jgi:hypothetical protein
MEIVTQYAVKRFVPNASFPQVYYEAIANALDAGADDIRVHTSIKGGNRLDRLDVTVQDNGVGFTDVRFGRFCQLQEPHDEFHKGLGRLVFLQYFKSVNVSSITEDRQHRTFAFSNEWDGTSDVKPAAPDEMQATILLFSDFEKARLRSYDHLRPAILKNGVLDHFLPLLHHYRNTNRPFRIAISLDSDVKREQNDLFSDTVAIGPEDIPELREKVLDHPELGVFDRLTMWYAVGRNGGEGSVSTSISIDGRTVPLQLLKPDTVPPGASAVFLFESPAFAGKSDSTRQTLQLPETLSRKHLERILRREIALVLNEEMPEIVERNQHATKELENRYPHLLGLFEKNVVGLINREDALREAQAHFFEKQRALLDGGGVHDDASYRQSLELSSRTLTEYVLYREFILERLKELSATDREDEVHNLIVPRFRVFDGEEVGNDVYSNNAWILDDKFMAFRTILSEKRMKEIISAITLGEEAISDDTRPDISMIFSADPAKAEAVDVVVVEVKKREADDKEGPYAAVQLSARAQKLVDHCKNIRRMWYFGVIEIDAHIARLLRTDQWTPLYSKGYVFYRERLVERDDGEKIPAPTYLVSFDAVIQDAEARNHTFLELLKADIRRQGTSP